MVGHFTQSFSSIENGVVGTFANVMFVFVSNLYLQEILKWCIILNQQVVVTCLRRTSSTDKEIPACRRWIHCLELLLEIKLVQRFHPATKKSNIPNLTSAGALLPILYHVFEPILCWAFFHLSWTALSCWSRRHCSWQDPRNWRSDSRRALRRASAHAVFRRCPKLIDVCFSTISREENRVSCDCPGQKM